MAETKKIKKSGYSYLRAKIAKQEEEIAQLKAENIKLQDLASYANADCDSLKSSISRWQKKVLDLREELDLAIKRMGWFRRLVYGY